MQVRLDEEALRTAKYRTFSDLKANGATGFTRSTVAAALRKHGVKQRAADLGAEQLLREWRTRGLIIYQGHKAGWIFVESAKQ